MAVDWIKMRADLHTHPKIVRIMSALKADRLRVIGGLHAVWCLFDAHSTDGFLDGYDFETLDNFIGWPGFSGAMNAIDWLEGDENGLFAPRFDEHNGQSAKRRAQESERKRNDRKTSASDADKKRTREEKRRVDSKPPLSPKGEKKAAVCLSTFIAECTEKSERPMRDYQPLWKYVESVGLDREMVGLAWAEFCRQMLPGGVNATKRQADWRKTFRNYVEKNYLKLWAIDPEGKFFLTTAGKTAQKIQDGKDPE